MQHDSSSSEELIIDYVNLQTSNNIMKYIFNYGPISIPIPELRERIEYKIIQEFFIRNYNLPQEFKFANYICRVLKHYLIDLVEVRPISWIILACFVALNVLRIEFLDKIFAYEVCEQYPAKNLHRSSSTAHRLLSMIYNTSSSDNSNGYNGYYFSSNNNYNDSSSSSGGIVHPYAGEDPADDHHDDNYIEPYAYHVCQEYLLRYTLMCLFFIVLYVIGVLIASEIYIQRLIDKVLDQEETIEWLQEEEEQRIFYMNQESNLVDTGLVDINALPDDTVVVDGVKPAATTSGIRNNSNNSGEMKRDSTSTDGGIGGSGAGMEYTDIYNNTTTSGVVSTTKPVPHNPTTTNATNTGGVSPRRLSANYRMASLRARNNSVDDFLETGALPPPPVHGTAALRRLTINHRMASSKGSDLSSFMAAATAAGNSNNAHNTGTTVAHHPGSDAIAHAHTVLQRRRLNSAGSTGSLRSDIDTSTTTAGGGSGSGIHTHTRPTSLPTTQYQQSQLQSQLSLDMETPTVGLQNVRRLALQHRAGSLRSETEGDSGNILGNVPSTLGNFPHNNTNNHTINSPVPPRRRLMANYRTGSLRSDISESRGSSGNGGNQEKTDLVNTSKNRRFLYLRCLERIMHVEFDFHANEAKHMSHADESNGASTGDTHSMHGNHTTTSSTSNTLKEVLHSPIVNEKREQQQHRSIHRTQSLSSMHESDAHVHSDMRSNFALMKSLRQEMLQEQENLAQAEAAALAVVEGSQSKKNVVFFGTGGIFSSITTSTHGGGASGSTHGTKELPLYTSTPTTTAATTTTTAAVGMKSTNPTAVLNNSHSEPALYTGFRPIIARRNSKEEGDLETGGTNIQERYSNHSNEGLEMSNINHNNNKNHITDTTTDNKTQRKRALSLAFQPEHSKIPGGFLSKPNKPQSNKFMQFLSYISYIIYIRFYSAMLGHHIGEAHEHKNADIAEMEKDFSKIFLFHNSELYYFMVEFCLLAQCVYLALWATNFVFIALDSYYPILWSIALILPIPLNFIITKQIIFTAAMLKSILTLNKTIADKICENAIDERNIKHRIRKVIRTSLKNLDIVKSEWVQYIQDQFELYIPDDSINNSINIHEFTLFLHSISIFLTDTTVLRIFKVIDINRDNYIDFDNLFPIIFPELMKKQVKIKRSQSDNNNDGPSYRIQGDLSNSKIKKKEKNELRKIRRASSVNKDATGSVVTDIDLTEQTFGLISPSPSPLPYSFSSHSINMMDTFTSGGVNSSTATATGGSGVSSTATGGTATGGGSSGGVNGGVSSSSTATGGGGSSGSIKQTRFAENLTSTQHQQQEQVEESFNSDASDHGSSSSDSDSDSLFEEYNDIYTTTSNNNGSGNISRSNSMHINSTSDSGKGNSSTYNDHNQQQQSIYAQKRPSTTMFDV